MKKYITLVALVCFVAVGYQATAQMDKAEAKEWKKRIKALEPEQYKALIEENKSLKSQVASLRTELEGVDDRIADKDDQISQYQNQVAKLRDELAEANTKPAQPVAKAGTGDENVGVIFRVQIGAYEKKDLGDAAKNAKNFNQQKDGSLNKYSVGAFRDYWEADTFKKYLREMGVKDAFIVSFKDGQPVPIKDVLEGVTKS